MLASDRSTPRRRRPRALAALAVLAACGGAGGDAPAAVAPPARAGEVWELDSAASRATAPAALQAYVHGMHVLVLDDDVAYAGMTRLAATAGDGGARTVRLAGGGEARLTRAGESMELRFPDGAVVHLRRQPERR